MKPNVKHALDTLFERSQSGVITPQEIVEAARDEQSPLHDSFEWDNRRAGNLYRLTQARDLLGRYEVIIQRQPVRAFVRVESQGGYMRSEAVVTDRDLYAEVYRQFCDEVDALLERNRRWENLAPVKLRPKIKRETTSIGAANQRLRKHVTSARKSRV